MKHLKKLSVVLMLTTLFSVTFTSCIDNEVSPVVEAIYASQADLIAAQASVQNAEAVYRLALAEAQEAQAALTIAQAAQADAYAAQINAQTASTIADNAYAAATRVETLRALVATTNANIAATQNAMALAETTFQAAIAAAIAAMENAGAQVAVGYATQYAYFMNEAAGFKATKLQKEGELALNELYLKAGSTPETTWPLYLASLNAKLSAEQAKVTAAEAAIVALNTAKANPTARETQIAGLKDQVATLTARKAELVALIAVAEKNRVDAVAAKNAATDFMNSTAVGSYTDTKNELNIWKAAYTADTTAITTQSEIIAAKTDIIANYAANYTTRKGAVNTALGVIGWKAMTTDALVIANPYVGTATSPATGLLKDIAAVTAALGVYGTSPVYGDTPRSGAALTAYGKLWNADLALLTFEQDFAGLTATYNTAASNLVTATNIYNITDWTGIAAAAATAVTTAQGNLTTDIAYYNAKKAIFEAAPAGDTWFDLTTPLGNTSAVVEPYTNTKIGIHTDDATFTTSYSLVTGWIETVTGNGIWKPTGLATAMYVALPVGSTEFVANVSVGAGNPAPVTPYYVEVEADDKFETNVALFNKASELLGVEITAPFYTIPVATRIYAANFSAAPVTSYQALWNAQKLVNQIAYNQANAADILADAQDEYDYQKALFETGLATRATLEADVDAAVAVIGKVKTTTPASGLLGDKELLEAKLGSDNFLGRSLSDPKLTTGASPNPAAAFYTVGTVKTLTAYAELFNARKDLNALVSVSLAQHKLDLAAAEAALTAATLEAAEDLIIIAKFTADLAALQARYDALILTPLYAALEVAVGSAEQAKAALVAEDGAATISISSLSTVITALTTTVTDYTSLIATQNAIILASEAIIFDTHILIEKGGVSLEGLQAAVTDLKAQIALLTQKIANSEALAAKYKALMEAALLAA